MKQRKILTAVFLLLEAVLYYFILTAGGTLLTLSSYGAIVLCLLYSLLAGKSGLLPMQMGLVFTAAADFCLVICDPIQRLWGMVFFLGTQLCYGLFLHSRVRGKGLWILRIALTAVALVVTALVLGDGCDALALISLAYYANLLVNLVVACVKVRKNWQFAVALVLFMLCDTVIGLQVCGDLYLPITEGSLLYGILYSGFNLSWLFYLPSQVLLAWIAAGRGEKASV